MALVDNRWQRLSTLCALYVAQGVPYGFMTITLMAYLAEQGVDPTKIGTLMSIVLWPWALKLVWGPLIDSVTIRSMGRRRPWIILAEFFMAATLLWMMTLDNLASNLPLLGGMFFLHNCFASLQDVSTDAMALDVLPTSEQGSANGLMWGSKLIGKGLAATAMGVMLSRWGLSSAILVQFVVLMIIMLFPLLIVERPGEKRFPWSRGQAATTAAAQNVRNPLRVFLDTLGGFSLRTTAVFALFGITQLVGYSIYEVLYKTLYAQQLGWEQVEVSYLAGTKAVIPILIGALGGGFLAHRLGRKTIIFIGAGGVAVSSLVFVYFSNLWMERSFAAGYVLATEGFGAMASVGFLALAMRISWTAAAATMFTTYMTVSNIGHVVGNWIAGPVHDWCGEQYAASLTVSAVATLLPLLLLLAVDPRQVDHRISEDIQEVEESPPDLQGQAS